MDTPHLFAGTLADRLAALPGVDHVSGAPDLGQRWHSERTVLVSEPFAWARELSIGESLRLRTATGRQAFTVAGIFRDYGASSYLELTGYDQARP